MINVIIIVTRYFGGVKLGVGPLGKAYYLAAYEVLKKSSIISKQLFQKCIINSDFENISSVHRILAKKNSKILESNYDEDVKLICLINIEEIDEIEKLLGEISKSKAIINPLTELIYC